MGGEYADDLRRTPDGWRSVRRSLRVFFELGSREVLGMRAAGHGGASEARREP